MFSLCLDIGNTLAKMAIFEDDRLVDFRTVDIQDDSILAGLFEIHPFEAAILSSVSEIPPWLVDLLNQKTNSFFVLDHHTRLPIKNLYKTKKTLGKDRLAAVVGASFLHPQKNTLVIDAGTAITFDIISSRSEYLGGNISPGIQMRYKALNSFTNKLPLLNLIDDYSLYGTSTNDAIISGVLQGVVAEVEGTIDLFKLQFPELKILVTGGDAKFFEKNLKSDIFVVSYLVPLGLNRILQHNLTIVKA